MKDKNHEGKEHAGKPDVTSAKHHSVHSPSQKHAADDGASANSSAATSGASDAKSAASLSEAAASSHAKPSEKIGFFQKLFTKKAKNTSAKAGAPGQKPGQPPKLDVHLTSEMLRLKKEREKKEAAKKHEKIFTTRGLIRSIDLQSYLEKAGVEADPKKIAKTLLIINTVLFIIASILVSLPGIMLRNVDISDILLFLAAMWASMFYFGLGMVWAVYLFYIDMKIYQRTMEVEKVFPDFLQLASSNISAGMPIDRALWHAVRPNFGILSKEIETIAKNTLTGQDLAEALREFARKYESKTIKRSVSLLLEGLAAGGELAELLDKIALNIEETRILKRDMAANVTTYVIFTSFASVVAAPVLLGLSSELLQIITRITSAIATENPSSSAGFISFTFSSDPDAVKNFRIFSYVMLIITSVSAAAIVNIIQKGRVKDGLFRIPTFVPISVLIYLVSSSFIGTLFVNII